MKKKLRQKKQEKQDAYEAAQKAKTEKFIKWVEDLGRGEEEISLHIDEWCKQHGGEGDVIKSAPMAGWKCPSCGRGLAPFVSVCPCVQTPPPPPYFPQPILWSPVWPPYGTQPHTGDPIHPLPGQSIC